MNRFRTDVENLFLAEMVEEDRDFIMMEDAIDDIIPENTKGLFGDDNPFGDSSSGDDLDSILDNEDYDLF